LSAANAAGKQKSQADNANQERPNALRMRFLHFNSQPLERLKEAGPIIESARLRNDL
jgi:hypothetical protein